MSQALGFGFRCGFLGLLHMEIVQERLEREFDQDLITTAPTVVYQVVMRDGTVIQVENPSKLPEIGKIEEIREPIITTTIFVPQDYLGTVITLCNQKRGNQVNMRYHGRQVQADLRDADGRSGDGLLRQAEVVLARLCLARLRFQGVSRRRRRQARYPDQRREGRCAVADRASRQLAYRGRELAAKMRELIPRQMYDVAIQAAIGSHIIARENVKAMRKDVLAKCYGGDITRKKKLLEKQKAGKKRMKQVGSVEIPQEAFLAVLRVDN